MLGIFSVSYFISAASFYLLYARSGRPTPFPKWIWQRREDPAEFEEAA